MEFVTRFDAEPEFWQFLSGLKFEDVITELVQNELDAEAQHTRICFGAESLTCEGNGKPIDDDGWARLSYMRGAGNLTPRKRFRIGVKNHGLKACFTLGDEISLLSAGLLARQTLYRDGSDSPPRPGAFERPVRDSSAPSSGCRIIVPFRTKRLVTLVGEPLEFAAPSRETIDALFVQACQEAPGKFIGAIRPGIRDAYSLELSHHTRGETHLHVPMHAQEADSLGMDVQSEMYRIWRCCESPTKSARVRIYCRLCAASRFGPRDSSILCRTKGILCRGSVAREFQRNGDSQPGTHTVPHHLLDTWPDTAHRFGG
jgi:hypothetical protein